MAENILANPEQICTCCRIAKPLSLEFFYPARDRKCGISSRCKLCCIKRASAWRRQNLERARAADKACRSATKEKRAAVAREWQVANKERIYEATLKYRKANAERVAETRRAWVKKTRENSLVVRRKYRERNRDRILAAKRKSEAARYRANPWLKIRQAISRGMRSSLKNGKSRKSWKTLVGYSLVELTRHLERQFTKGMTWENYGKWHIDHILPISSFRITGTDCQEFRAAWAITNLQPMWAKENIAKSNHRLTLL